jgi:23S rRNA (adenine-N6)-dimethyltransferase
VPGGSRSRWGWYPLTSAAARRLVAEADVRAGELVLDLGAGTGALTAPLVDAGARVLAVERHTARAERLEQRFATDDVTVLRVDLDDVRLPNRSFRVVANPPFAHVSPLVRRLLAPGVRLQRADLVVPVQVAQRWTAKRPDRCSYQRLPRRSFRPEAPVPTAVLRIVRPDSRR